MLPGEFWKFKSTHLNVVKVEKCSSRDEGCCNKHWLKPELKKIENSYSFSDTSFFSLQVHFVFSHTISDTLFSLFEAMGCQEAYLPVLTKT